MADHIFCRVLAPGPAACLAPILIVFGRGLARRMVAIADLITDASSIRLYYIGHEVWDLMRVVACFAGRDPDHRCPLPGQFQHLTLPIGNAGRSA